ncbi:hypothetical protein DRQ05_02955 [bacterium]|nr:MAG: hypothetical protein DRQ05_02955 [bacterium]
MPVQVSVLHALRRIQYERTLFISSCFTFAYEVKIVLNEGVTRINIETKSDAIDPTHSIMIGGVAALSIIREIIVEEDSVSIV